MSLMEIAQGKRYDMKVPWCRDRHISRVKELASRGITLVDKKEKGPEDCNLIIENTTPKVFEFSSTRRYGLKEHGMVN